MPATLSDNERKLLHALIHSDSPEWWDVVVDKQQRNTALDSLRAQGLIEVNTDVPGVRATSRGIESNRRWIRSSA